MNEKQTIGKNNLRKGRNFEREVRKDLESKGMIVARWTNNIDLEKKDFIPAKQGMFRKVSTGFPDFIVIQNKSYFFFIECKTNGYLSPEEREKIEIIKSKGFKVYLAHKKYGELSYEKK